MRHGEKNLTCIEGWLGSKRSLIAASIGFAIFVKKKVPDKETFSKGEEIWNTDYNIFVEHDEAVSKPFSKIANHSWESSYDRSKYRKRR